jgi:pyruvate-ferredoxin/flavodoxin oxidoreductase
MTFTPNIRPQRTLCTDGNAAVADVAYRLNELCALYPITPSSPIGESCDEWSHQGRTNLWGTVPQVVEMQSEAGAAATLHGALQGGTLATTFTSSQGLLLMLPSMFKIAGELTPCVIHVAARAVASHALSIFGDHSDVMAVRSSGFAMLSAANVQEAHDFAALAQAVSLQTRIPFLHFFDGFRTSHEMRDYTPLPDEVLNALVRESDVLAHRARGMTPDHPVIRGTSQNPDVFFQGRERASGRMAALPEVLSDTFTRFAERTGRHYGLVDYTGHPEAEEVVVIMGSGGETAAETTRALKRDGRKVGTLQVRLYRPWPMEAFLNALPATTRRVAVLDRTKESGSLAEPLCLDVTTAVQRAGRDIEVIGGRYGLGSKEFTPAMVHGVFESLAAGTLPQGFTVGIQDDLEKTSVPISPEFHLESPDTTQAVFYGLGSDGTVGATKSSVEILHQAGLHAQGYFVYDSNKSGSQTESHLRFGHHPIRAPYLIGSASFVACHAFLFLETRDILACAAPGATFLLNAPYGAEDLPPRLPAEVREQIRSKDLQVFVVDATRVAREAGLGNRINTVMQTGFFLLSGVLEKEQALSAIRSSISERYARKGSRVVEQNLAAVEAAVQAFTPVDFRDDAPPSPPRPATVPGHAPAFVQQVTAPLLRGEGDQLPVSVFPEDGTYPVDTAKWNKRDLSPVAPVWEPDICIQCGHCVVICPHGVIQVKQAATGDLADAPATFPAPELRGRDAENRHYLLQLDLDQCTGCGLCVEICPAKSKTRANLKALHQEEKTPRLEQEAVHLDFFRSVPARHEQTQHRTLRGVQFLPQRFEFPGACAGCGETGVLKLISQLFGDRMLVANATGCSSIYGGNLPTTPWTVDENGRGPAWVNSLFEDNAEFGYGFRLAADQKKQQALQLVDALAAEGAVDPELADRLRHNSQEVPSEIEAQRRNLRKLDTALTAVADDPRVPHLRSLMDALVNRSVWIVGGDGWACDIGFGGVDHVLCSGRNVNLLVLDTEVYSNTGGQASKSTPLGAVAKFAAGGKQTAKTDLALHGILKGNVYVGTIALGAKLPQALKTLQEAEAWPGPSLVIAYSPCIAHGYPLGRSIDQQENAVASGHWPLLRYNPALVTQGKPGLQLDSGEEPTLRLREYMQEELRFRLLDFTDPDRAEALMKEAEGAIAERLRVLRALAE